MKNLKKLIALVAVLALTLSTVALGATYTDVAEDSAYSVAVESLSKLGIVTGYEDGTYGPEKAVTRAEMAALIARIQGYEETASAQTATVFTDVPADHWASGYVAAASNMGIVNGYGDGTFGPEDTVKYEQAVTMLMRTLGYEPFAAANGGYPTGYLAAAQRYGVTKNVSNAVSGTDANRGTIAQLLYNGIDTALMGQSKWGTDGDIEYTIYDGTSGKAYKTLMSENLKVVKVKGVVASNVATSFTGANTINIEEDEKVKLNLTSVYDTTDENFYTGSPAVMRGSMDFRVNGTDIADALGYSVIAYVVEDEVKNDTYNVVSYAIDSATNSKVEFTLGQFAGVKDAKTLEYYRNATDNEPTSIVFENSSVPVIYNYTGGYALSGIFGATNPVDVDSKYSGKVVAIDNDTTYGYDLAIVEISESRVVKKATDDRVTFKKGSALDINFDATDVIIKLTKDGEAIAHTDLTEWDVVTVLARADQKYINAEVIGSTLVGKVEATKTSKTSATTGNKAYRIEGAYYDVAVGAFESDNIDIGEGGTFYVDKYGKIVAFNEDATLVGGSAGTYAYVIEAGKATAFNTEYAQIRLLTANGVDIYDVAEDITYNGVDTEIVADAATPTAGQMKVSSLTGAINTSMIQYKVNAEGEIDEIETAAGSEFAQVGSGTHTWDADNYSLGGIIDEDAQVLLSTSNVKTESKVGTIADLEDNESYTYIKFLDDKGEDANVVLITSGFASVGAGSGVAVVTEVALEVNEEGDDVLYVSYLQDGEEKSAYTNNTVYNANKSSLTAGDIVKVKTTDGVITSLNTYVGLAEDIYTGITGINKVVNGKEEYVFGQASSGNDNTSAVTVRDFGSVRLDRAENVYVVDASGKNVKIELGDSSDYLFLDEDYAGVASLEDYLFIRKYDGGVEDVVVVKAAKKVRDLTDTVKNNIKGYNDNLDAIDAMLTLTALADTDLYDTVVAAPAYSASTNATAKAAFDAAVVASGVSTTSSTTVADIITAIETARAAL